MLISLESTQMLKNKKYPVWNGFYLSQQEDICIHYRDVFKNHRKHLCKF